MKAKVSCLKITGTVGYPSPGGRLPASWPKEWNCSITPDPAHPGRTQVRLLCLISHLQYLIIYLDETQGRCVIQPGRLLGSGLTYRYGADPLFPFGYGYSSSLKPACLFSLLLATLILSREFNTVRLSYTAWKYSALAAPATIAVCENLTVRRCLCLVFPLPSRTRQCLSLRLFKVAVTVTNAGKMAAAETVQAYVRWVGSSVPTAELQLVAFEKVRHPELHFSMPAHAKHPG